MKIKFQKLACITGVTVSYLALSYSQNFDLFPTPKVCITNRQARLHSVGQPLKEMVTEVDMLFNFKQKLRPFHGKYQLQGLTPVLIISTNRECLFQEKRMAIGWKYNPIVNTGRCAERQSNSMVDVAGKAEKRRRF